MKPKIAVFSILAAFSNSSTADWFDGWNNSNTQGTETGKSSGWGAGTGDGSTSGQSNVSGWGTSKGDTDGEVNFSIKFKGRGRTTMDTKMSGDGHTDFAGNAISNSSTAGSTAGHFIGSGAGSRSGAYQGNPWSYGGYNPYGYGMSPLPAQRVMPVYPIQVPHMQQMMPRDMHYPYGYINAYQEAYQEFGNRPQMLPQAPSYQEVIKKQEAIREQIQAQGQGSQ